MPAISILYHFLSSLARPLCPGAIMLGSMLEKMSRSNACWSDLVYKTQFP